MYIEQRRNNGRTETDISVFGRTFHDPPKVILIPLCITLLVIPIAFMSLIELLLHHRRSLGTSILRALEGVGKAIVEVKLSSLTATLESVGGWLIWVAPAIAVGTPLLVIGLHFLLRALGRRGFYRRDDKSLTIGLSRDCFKKQRRITR